MTLEELRNKKITVTVDKTITLGEDLNSEMLSNMLEDQIEENYSDKELLDAILYTYYSSNSDLDGILDFEDYEITIHD